MIESVDKLKRERERVMINVWFPALLKYSVKRLHVAMYLYRGAVSWGNAAAVNEILQERLHLHTRKRISQEVQFAVCGFSYLPNTL